MIRIEDIVNDKKEEVENEKRKESIDELLEKIKKQEPPRDFLSAISKPNKINIIAEIKIKSPSMHLRRNLDPIEVAKQYEDSDVVAISVLTDKKYFAGTKEMMQNVRKVTTKPILRKDFIIDEYQIYQARAYGADAILLISHLLSKKQMEDFIQLSRSLGMECLVEYGNKADFEKIPSNVTNIYGKNRRKLNCGCDLQENLHYGLQEDVEYIGLIPRGKIGVIESINGRGDMEYFHRIGFNVFLIGSLFSNSRNIKQTIKELYSPSLESCVA